MGEVHDEELRAAYQESIDAGKVRLSRNWAGLIATGFVGGLTSALGCWCC
jgi:hypothetical protein